MKDQIKESQKPSFLNSKSKKIAKPAKYIKKIGYTKSGS